MKPTLRPTAASPEPGNEPQHPWRFTLGQDVYALQHPEQDTFKVLGGELFEGFPHLFLLSPAGVTWRIPQIHVSSKPIIIIE